MLVVIAVTAIITVSITNSVLFFYRANTSSLEQTYQVDNARAGVNALVRDLREATYADNGAYPVATLASTSLAFYSDTDRDNSVELIRYTIIGSSLYRVVTDSAGTPPTYTGAIATSTISTYVWNLSQGVTPFRYYDASGAEITNYTNLAGVRSVTVNLIVNVNPVRAPGEFSLRSSATLRNLRSQ